MTQQELSAHIDAFIAKNTTAIVDDIAALVAIPSVEGSPAPNAPFGTGPRKALDAALAIAQRMGLETHDGEGYVGWAELPGEEAGHLATITHLDVVPEGTGWTGAPFTLSRREGWLIGRGVADDKGPSVLCLYAARFFKELGAPLRYGLRVLLGCSEETGMGDLPHYFAHNPQPLFCFSPDADFPVCNGEKGHYLGHFISQKLEGGRILDFSAGLAPNVIPDKATCLVNANPAMLAPTAHVAVADENGKARLAATGLGGHAAKPEGTRNAIGVLVAYLMDNNLYSPQERDFLQLCQKLHTAWDGSALAITCRDDVFDALTVNGGVMTLKDGRLHQSIDIRYPTATTGTALEAALTAAATAHGASLESDRIDEPFYIPADSPAIQTLLNTYNEIAGQNQQPFTMGGGTYARHFKNAVSYGPQNPAEARPAFAGAEHSPDEAASLAGLLQALKIYILALWRLQSVDF